LIPIRNDRDFFCNQTKKLIRQPADGGTAPQCGRVGSCHILLIPIRNDRDFFCNHTEKLIRQPADGGTAPKCGRVGSCHILLIPIRNDRDFFLQSNRQVNPPAGGRGYCIKMRESR
jgi:hypothetical protein